MPGSSKVSDSWYAIVLGANGIPTDSGLSEDMRKVYEQASAKLMDKDGNTTPHYEAYLRYQDEYKAKVKQWMRAYADAFTDPMKLQNWPNTGRMYHDDADDAHDRWSGLGFKQEIESAISTLAAQGIDPAMALIVRAKKRFINSLNEFQSIGQIPYTVLLPGTWYNRDNDDGWAEYTSHDFHTESHYTESSTSYGGGGGLSLGFWSAAGGLEHSEQRVSMDIRTNNLEIAFKYAVVDVKRPWLDTSLLNLRNWFLMGNYKAQCISRGVMSQESPSGGLEVTFLPSIVTSLVLIKDLSIKWDNWKSDFQSITSATSGGGSIGWGPFAVSGHHSHHGAQRDFVADSDGESLTIPGIQLIGYVSFINPPTP
jgi:hypothetical protein